MVGWFTFSLKIVHEGVFIYRLRFRFNKGLDWTKVYVPQTRINVNSVKFSPEVTEANFHEIAFLT